ncbi:CRISPR-associated helicase Cas3' [Rhodovulum sulfidophilum]|uniref:CRISPR-associated helicase Cas3' n=1 Tax=Rhodovulum sulfidophilum TaxID=35806 RepID=UPI0019228F03|nr:CRISPR-associated helicase Cas3' [Rhodovulum sulfidophilum]MBL3560906.1 CRISPR-associated helicase Cas3' [Rhodovulum sulfidophilum]MBL3565004.1 CRISPR-associated helicase Cas3' [Rhodovulum sulfidophilum]
MGILDWPGKSASISGSKPHPAAYHMLDVAAVFERLIEPFGVNNRLRDALVLLSALHDLGKISDSFRCMLEERAPQRFRHWQLTEVLLYEFDPFLAEHLGGTPWVRQLLYASVSGHHGRPSKLDLGGLGYPGRRPRDYRLALAAIGSAQADAATTLSRFCELWPDASLDEVTEDHAVTLSWWLSGICTAADWVGSNTSWFQPKAEITSLKEYLDGTRRVAVDAVCGAGLSGALTRNERLFDFALRPMQAACADVPMIEGPMLAVIEDETGAGKTEAALLLAQRMLLAGKGRGMFVALPTMATADAMFRRAADVVGKLFGEDASLTLAHGRAGLSVAFRDIVNSTARSEDDATCSDWLAESRRRALLADVGVGTIDQALLSVLPVKFQALRHFGLSSKILIVDEVHELGEPYIGAELEALLRMHRAVGGSAILLTATLPMKQRARLLSIYGGLSDSPAYPALTVAGGVARTDLPQVTGPKGAVQVVRLANQDDAVAILAERAGRGSACVWVRNAVDDAISAVELLRSRGIEARLLHARFALSDRKRIEAEILARVGKAGVDRSGFVLVGTQVLEASLDLDFDVMVSDLAPMAALVQRAGRLWRHMDVRPGAARPVPAPILHVLSPDPGEVTSDRWLQSVLDRGAYVYPVADQWRTAKVLFDAGRIEAPSGLRTLIEAVHGEETIPTPDVLSDAESVAEGKGAAARGHAAQNIVELAAGYRMGGQANDDAIYPTRLGEEQRVLVLARWEDGRLFPWAVDMFEGWALSEVSARRSRLDALPLPDQSAPEIMAITRDWPDWKRAEQRLCPVAEDGHICAGLRYDERLGLILGEIATKVGI